MATTKNGTVNSKQAELCPEWFDDKVRGELVSATGHDIQRDDPILIVIALTEMSMRHLAPEVVKVWKAGTAEVGAKLEAMRAETTKATAADLVFLSNQARSAMELDFAVAEGKATRIMQEMEGSLRMHRMFWMIMGAVALALFGLGVLVGERVVEKGKTLHVIAEMARE